MSNELQQVWLAGIGAFGDVAVLSALIMGGKPEGLGDLKKPFKGCQDKTEAWDERGWFLPIGLRCGGYDKRWKSPVAVIDPDVTNDRPIPLPLVGLNLQQVYQCWAQLITEPPSWEAFESAGLELGTIVRGAGGCCSVMHVLGEFEGKPVLAWSPPATVKSDAPTALYLTAWIRAIQETFQLNLQGQRKMLRQLNGMDTQVLIALTKLLQEQRDAAQEEADAAMTAEYDASSEHGLSDDDSEDIADDEHELSGED